MSELLLPVILASFFGAVTLSVFVMHARVERRQRLARALGPETASFSTVREQQLGSSAFLRIARPLLTSFGRALKRITPLDTARKIEHKLVLAGAPEDWDVARTFAMKVVCALAAGALVALALGNSDAAQGARMGLAAIAALSGYMIPDIILSSKARKRQDEIRRSLPDTVDLLTIMIEAGLGFDAAIAQVTVRVPGELSLEMSRMLREVRLGIPRMEAMKNMARRVEVEEFDSFVTSMIQAETFGVSVSKVLRAQSVDQRMKRRQRAERRAQQLPVKLVFPLIFCVMPSVFVVTLGPAVIKITQTFLT
jgi:tight adherence protein C